MKDKKIIIIIVIIVVLLLLWVVFNNSRKEKNNDTGTFEIPLSEYTESALEARAEENKVHDEIKSAIADVEETYQVAHSNHSEYKRSDFYNEQRLNTNMTNGTIEFVNSNEVSLENLYDLSGKKLSDLPSQAKTISNKASFQTGTLLLRCQSSSSNYTFYYLVKIGNTGLESYDYIFYTENEIFNSIDLEEPLNIEE